MGLKGMKNKIKQTKIKRDRGVWKKKSLRQRERNKKESVTMERNRKFIKRGKKEREWREKREIVENNTKTKGREVLVKCKVTTGSLASKLRFEASEF